MKIWFRLAQWAPGSESSVTCDGLRHAQDVWDTLARCDGVLMVSARP